MRALLVFLLLGCALPAHAQDHVFQSRLSVTRGNLPKEATFEVAVFDVPEGGDALYRERLEGVEIRDDGVFNLPLAATEPGALHARMPSGVAYLEVTLWESPERPQTFSPRRVINPGVVRPSQDLRTELDKRTAQLQARLVALENKTRAMRTQSLDGEDAVIFEGVNVHIQNGTGQTTQVNGAGNLILGYNAPGRGAPEPDDRAGSHNLVIGDGHAYPSSYGIVGGLRNRIEKPGAVVLTGMNNIVSGFRGAILTGSNLTVQGEHAAAVTGDQSMIEASYGAIMTGLQSKVLEPYGVVLSGVETIASGAMAVVITGVRNHAQGLGSVILAGAEGVTTGEAAVVATGLRNRVFGDRGLALGGYANTLHGDGSVVLAAIRSVTGGTTQANSGAYSVIVSGEDASTVGASSVIVTGLRAITSGARAVALTGRGANITGSEGVVVTGMNHRVDGEQAAVVTGANHVIRARQACVLGGLNNEISRGGSAGANDGDVIVGGVSNRITGLPAAGHVLVSGHREVYRANLLCEGGASYIEASNLCALPTNP